MVWNNVKALTVINCLLSGYKGNNSEQDYDQNIQQRLLEELMIDLLKIDQSKNNSLNYEVGSLKKTKSSNIFSLEKRA